MKRVTHHDYKFTNDYVFSTVMNNPKYCFELLSRILPEKKIMGIKALDTTSKVIKFEVIFEDESDITNVAIQFANEDSLKEQTRYSASQLNMDQLLSGLSYTNLKETYSIFLCTFDPIGEGKSIYAFEFCDVTNKLKLKDGMHTLYVNLTSEENGISKELRNLFDYILYDKLDDEDEFLCELDDKITSLNMEIGDSMKKYKQIRKSLEQMADEDYKEYIKALISFEKDIDEEEILDELYAKYMKNDNMSLLNDEFDCMIAETR